MASRVLDLCKHAFLSVVLLLFVLMLLTEAAEDRDDLLEEQRDKLADLRAMLEDLGVFAAIFGVALMLIVDGTVTIRVSLP